MAFNEKLGRGSLGKSKKTTKGAGPEYYGSLTIDAPIAAGEKVWLAGWIKENDQGDRFFSLVVERPQPQERGAPPRQVSVPRPAPSRNDIDDEIPF